MNACRPWRLPARLLPALAIAAGALALPAPGVADAPIAVIQAPADLPLHDGVRSQPAPVQAATASPSAAEAAPQDEAPKPGALYVLALVVAGLLGGWRRALS